MWRGQLPDANGAIVGAVPVASLPPRQKGYRWVEPAGVGSGVVAFSEQPVGPERSVITGFVVVSLDALDDVQTRFSE